jgi:hypothetical protein
MHSANPENLMLNSAFVEDGIHPHFISIGDENLPEMVFAYQIKQLGGSFLV